MSNDLSNLQINALLSGVKGYQGCYPCNGLPTRIPVETSYYVVNLERADQPGSHWCSIIVEPERSIYIDSFGFPPNLQTLAWLRRRQRPIFYSKRELQAYSSSRCGFYCCYFILQHAAGKSIERVLASFSGKVDQDERKIKDYFARRLQKS